ncbi:MAG TPA: nitrile hydratase subunit beta [Aeromicrobium sp.]|nr:nitrile hydratase subunit beta [Aeromicrobium sp.]
MHDLGGKKEFFAPIDHTPTEPVFHEEWEGRVFGIATFVQTLFGPNFDAFRSKMERLPRHEYFGPYYGRWLAVLEQSMRGYRTGERSVPRPKLVGTAALLKRVVLRPTVPRFLAAQVMPRIVGGAKRAKKPARFAVGDAVRVRAERAEGHTRQPGYATGRQGTIAAHHGSAVFADAHAASGSTDAEHLYVVAFDGAELWGDAAEPNTEVRIELFEPYLEPA